MNHFGKQYISEHLQEEKKFIVDFELSKILESAHIRSYQTKELLELKMFLLRV